MIVHRQNRFHLHSIELLLVSGAASGARSGIARHDGHVITVTHRESRFSKILI